MSATRRGMSTSVSATPVSARVRASATRRGMSTQRVRGPALAEYQRVSGTAWDEYWRVRNAAWDEYQRAHAEAFFAASKIRQ